MTGQSFAFSCCGLPHLCSPDRAGTVKSYDLTADQVVSGWNALRDGNGVFSTVGVELIDRPYGGGARERSSIVLDLEPIE
jgi:hypothetical protein